MNPLLSVAKLFTASIGPHRFEENFESAFLIASLDGLTIPSESDFRKVINLFPKRDLVHCDVRVDETDPVSFHSHQMDQFSTSASSLSIILQVAGESPRIEFTVTVEKQVVENQVSIFALDSWTAYICSLPFRMLLQKFSQLVAARSRVQFLLAEPLEGFNTNSFWFVPWNSPTLHPDSPKDRDGIMAKRNEVCHFENASEVRIIPDDFLLSRRSNSAKLDDIFDKLCIATCLIFIADIVQFRDENTIFCKLNGYKALTKAFTLNEIPQRLAAEIFKVYAWIYEGGVLTDKVGLARNLISLHAKQGNILDLDAEVFTSILSGYQIYLKQNVKQYIEIKNKLIEFWTELSKKAARLGENLGDTLGKNFVAFASFFLSVVVVKAIANKDFTGIFSPKLAAIAYALLSASFIHLIVSVLLLNREIRQMERSYAAVQNRYADLLDPHDLKNAFNNDDEYGIMLSNIRYKRGLYGSAWFLYLLIFGLLVAFLTATDNANQNLQANGTAVVSGFNVGFGNPSVTNAASVTNAGKSP